MKKLKDNIELRELYLTGNPCETHWEVGLRPSHALHMPFTCAAHALHIPSTCAARERRVNGA